MSQTLKNPLVLTPGEPAGIGPELAIQLAQQALDTPVVFMASRELILARAAELKLTIKLIDWQGQEFNGTKAGEMVLKDVPLNTACTVGLLDVNNAPYVLKCLDLAIDGCLGGEFSALVTGPLHKGIINDAGIPFSGHTEHLQARCECSRVVMMLASPSMKVALATTHLPLKDVASAIQQQPLQDTIGILIQDMQQKFGCPRPKILLAGLNPHAGEGGHMGREEIDIIEPAMRYFADQPCELIGPLPADTLFTPKYLDQCDAVLAMYHDQGLPVLKYGGFGKSVNITLGLPIIRTSVDHGTALDIAGQGIADLGSLQCAINMASEMASHSQYSGA